MRAQTYLDSLASSFLMRGGCLVDDANGDTVLDERKGKGKACGAGTDLQQD